MKGAKRSQLVASSCEAHPTLLLLRIPLLRRFNDRVRIRTSRLFPPMLKREHSHPRRYPPTDPNGGHKKGKNDGSEERHERKNGEDDEIEDCEDVLWV